TNQMKGVGWRRPSRAEMKWNSWYTIDEIHFSFSQLHADPSLNDTAELRGDHEILELPDQSCAGAAVREPPAGEYGLGDRPGGGGDRACRPQYSGRPPRRGLHRAGEDWPPESVP